ncbi:MAG TPA: hypothetical protein DIS76_06325 [Rhodospirillaceae bacterium]|nr:hypothetical protein [Rhodospirillaceae bacterium]
MHEIFGMVAIVFLAIAYFTYIRSLWRGESKPHFFTWVIWTITTSITLATQLAEHAGPGAWTTMISLVLLVGITIYAFFRGEKNFTHGDWVSLIAAAAALVVWYFTDEAGYAAVIVTTIDCLAYYPTFRKTWSRPYEENITSYVVQGLKHGLACFALSNVTLATASYPSALAATNLVFGGYGLWRRNKMRAIIPA